MNKSTEISSSNSFKSPILKFQEAVFAVMAIKDLMKSEEEEDDDYGDDFDVSIDYGTKFHPDQSSNEIEYDDDI